MNQHVDGVFGKRVPDAALLASYKRTGSVHKTAVDVGLCHQSVHERLIRLGIPRNIENFTKAERERLQREYAIFRDAGKLDELARSMARRKTSICRIARALGLTSQRANRGHEKWAGRWKWKYMSEDAARALFGLFQRQRGTVTAFCRRRGLAELGFGRTMRRFFPDQWEMEVEARAPKQTMYRFGRQFEYRVRDALRELGYFVLRSPQSRSPLDLIAIRRGSILFVQCKRSGALGVSDWNALLDLATSVGAVPLLAETAKTRGHILYWRLLDRKDGSKRVQPRGAFLPEHA